MSVGPSASCEIQSPLTPRLPRPTGHRQQHSLMTSAITRHSAGGDAAAMVRRKLFRWRSGPRRHSRLVAKAVPSWARQVHMAGPGHSWKARWAVDVGPEKAAASTSALEMESFLPDLVIPIRLTVTEDVASLSVPACLPARPPPPRRKAERNREPATVQQQVSDVPSETASEVSCGTTARTGSNARGISRRNCSVFLLGNSGRASIKVSVFFHRRKVKT